MKKRQTTPRPGPIDKHRPRRLPQFDLAPALSCSPREIVRDEHDQVGKLVVSLAVVFNDLKGLVMSQVFLKDARAAARTTEEHGQVSGLIVQSARWTMGLVHELLDLIRDKSDVIDSSEFRELLQDLAPDSAGSWEAIEAVARGREGGDSELRRALARCRNSAAFHYSDKRSFFWRGFLDAFESDPRPAGVAVGRPAFSDGHDMEASRFYFADAAVKTARRAPDGPPIR